MAATLERHASYGQPTASNIPARETIPCWVPGCEFSYTISYTEDENLQTGTEPNVATMRRLAIVLIEKAHPVHRTKNFNWKGAEQGWVEADSRAARMGL